MFYNIIFSIFAPESSGFTPVIGDFKMFNNTKTN